MKSKPLNYVLVAASLVLIIVGLKFTSIGVGPSNLLQDDGYNVTGGIMTMMGGIIIGMLLGLKAKK